MYAVREGERMPVQARAAAIPLREGIDLQDVEPLFGPMRQIRVPFLVADIGKSAPTGIGQPEKVFSVLQQMGMILGNL